MRESLDCDLSKSLVGRIEQWWSDLHRERRCNNTNAIYKSIIKTPLEEQNKVRELIAKYIKDDISKSIASKSIVEMTSLCNSINGCFDNFTQATDAANSSFNEIIVFIDTCVDECLDKLFTRKISKFNTMKILDLLHCLSRILVLLLKLRRPTKCEDQSFPKISENVKFILGELSYKLSKFLLVDEVLMDTKYNMTMSCLLIREILRSRDKLTEYHERFLSTLPEKLNEKDYKLNIIKFLLSNAFLNTWSKDIIDVSSVEMYLRFYIKFCESYSTDTACILNVSRALLLLVKSDCFKEYANTLFSKDSALTCSMLSCIWMLLDHPVACIRHSAKDFLQLLTVYDKFKLAMLNLLSTLPCDKRSYFTTLAALANQSGSHHLLEVDRKLPQKLILAVYDPTLASYVIFALECLILRDSLVDENFFEWCDVWIVPLIASLSEVPLVVAADIEKLLNGIFKRHPSAVFYVINKWSDPKSDDQFRYMITALKIYHRLGLKMQNNSVYEKKDGVAAESNKDVQEGKWKDIITEKLLMCGLHHNEDDVRVSAFSLIIQGLKSTEIYTKQDFALIRYFLTYNLNNQHPAARQKILALINKMLARYADSLIVIKRMHKTSPEFVEDFSNYKDFQNWIIDFCFSNIFDGANFNRLNTVLNILLYCLEYMGSIEIDHKHIKGYWSRILVALRSSYEENKVMAMTLAMKLSIHQYMLDDFHMVTALFSRAFGLCGKMEPPNVLTGAYLIQVAIEFPSFNKVAEHYLLEDTSRMDAKLLCVRILAKKLKEQMECAERNLIKAAITGPMYGLLSAIRLIVGRVDFAEVSSNGPENIIVIWSRVIDDLINIIFKIVHIVSCVVNSSSPEGHLPSDFQSDFEFFISENCFRELRDQCEMLEEEIRQPEVRPLDKRMETIKLDEKPRNIEEIFEDCDLWLRRFNRIFLSVTNSTSFSQKNATDFMDLLEQCGRLTYELEHESKNANVEGYLQCLSVAREKLEDYLEMYGSNRFNDGRPTAQILLLCAWRSIKESCLFLGDLLSKLPLEKMFELKLITEDMIMNIGEELRTLLCEIRHRGAFEQAYIGFSQLINALWKCPRKNASELPRKWLMEILEEIKLPLEKQKMKLCSNRRSAGLPFLVQAIVSSELKCMNSAKIETLDITMNMLLNIVEMEEDSISSDCRVHSLNVLRALFKHAMLGEHVAPYVSRALMVAIRGSRAAAWSHRNSCNLLFSSLVIRIFGVARNKDTLSKKNRMTSRTFFQRYPELYEFFLSEMRLAFQYGHRDNEYYPQPNIFHILLILGRLYPPPTEDPVRIDLLEFRPLINISCCNATLKIRELGARALVSIISPDHFKKELNQLFSALFQETSSDNNRRHGAILQLKALLSEMSSNHGEILKESIQEKGFHWIENTRWIISETNRKNVPFFLKYSYLQLLHILLKTSISVIEPIENLFHDKKLFEHGNVLSNNIVPGNSIYLEILYFIKLEIACYYYVKDGECTELISLILSMLASKVHGVLAIALRFLLNIYSKHGDHIEEDNVNSVAVKIGDLHGIEKLVGDKALLDGVNKHIATYITNFLVSLEMSSTFVHKVITMLWMSFISRYLLQDQDLVCTIFSGLDKEKLNSLLNSLLYLIENGDTVTSVSSFICYSIFFFNKLRTDGDLSPDVVTFYVKLLFSFSDPNADVIQRMAVSDIFYNYYHLLSHRLFIEDNQALSIWILPLRLISDEEPAVRKRTMCIINRYVKHLNVNFGINGLVVDDELSVPKLTTVPLKAQEYLLDCYILFFIKRDIFHLIVQMVGWCLAGYIKAVNCEHTTKQKEAGIFEKGNPNPFCEDLAFANLLCSKLEQLKTTVDLTFHMTQKLSPTHIKSLQDIFPTITLPSFPSTLHELGVHIINIITEEDVDNNSIASLLPFYINRLKNALNL